MSTVLKRPVSGVKARGKVPTKTPPNTQKRGAVGRKKKRHPPVLVHRHPKALKVYQQCKERLLQLRELKTRYDGLRVSDFEYSAGDMSTTAVFVDPLTVYRFRLAGHTTINLSTGVVDTFVAADPSASGWNCPEWATLSALFSTFRLCSLTIQLVTQPWNGTALNTTTAGPVLMIASNLGTAIAPGSYAALADNADSKLWNTTQDKTKCGYTHTMRASQLAWSEVTSPTTDPYAGAPGSIQIYGTFGSLSQTAYVHCLISGIYEFRVRV